MPLMTVPDDVQQLATKHLAGQSEERRETFALRLERWWPDVTS